MVVALLDNHSCVLLQGRKPQEHVVGVPSYQYRKENLHQLPLLQGQNQLNYISLQDPNDIMHLQEG